jgi:hypothetical protein
MAALDEQAATGELGLDRNALSGLRPVSFNSASISRSR